MLDYKLIIYLLYVYPKYTLCYILLSSISCCVAVKALEEMGQNYSELFS